MTFDEHLAERVRRHLDAESGVTERKMFGGLSFLVDGHMAVAVRSHGGLMFRVEPVETARLIAAGQAQRVEMRGRPMRGWLHLDAEQIDDDQALAKWVDRATMFARGLPPKV